MEPLGLVMDLLTGAAGTLDGLGVGPMPSSSE